MERQEIVSTQPKVCPVSETFDRERINFDTALIMCAGKATRDLPHSLYRTNTLGEIGQDTNAFNEITRELGGIGVRNLIVTVPGDNFIAPGINLTEVLIRRWFDGDLELQTMLIKENKKADLVGKAGPKKYGIERISFAYQSADVYGTTWGVGSAINQLSESKVDGVIIVSGDGFNYRSDGGSDLKDLVEKIYEEKTDGGLIVTTAPKLPEDSNEEYKYGLIIRSPDGRFERIWERAPADKIHMKEDLLDANASIYALKATSLLPSLERHMKTPLSELGSPEHWFTDVLGWMVKDGHNLSTLEPVGEFVDCATYELREKAKKLLYPVGSVS